MYYINSLRQELSTAKTYEHNLLDEKSVIDRHRSNMAAKLDEFVDENHSRFSRYTGYQNFIRDPISQLLLLILAHVLLMSCL